MSAKRKKRWKEGRLKKRRMKGNIGIGKVKILDRLPRHGLMRRQLFSLSFFF